MWHSLFGYVIIRMEGFGLERFINKMLQSGIFVWNITRESATAMTAEIRAKHFIRLRPLKRGLRLRVHILKRRGMPFLIAQLSCRKALLIGGLALFAGLVAASSRIWLLSIEGLYRVEEQVVRRALDEAGAYVGMGRADVLPIELGGAVRGYDERIAWVGVRVDGVTLRVRVVEAEPIPPRADKSKPASVVAAKDGVIESVTALSGNPAVAAGDTVRAGDVLISGRLINEGKQTLYVHAEGEVTATVYYQAESLKPADEAKLEPTGASSPYRELTLAGITVYKSRPPYETFSLEVTGDDMVNGLLLPLRLIEGNALEMRERRVAADREEQLALALFEAEYRALDMIPREARILDKVSETQLLSDGSVLARMLIRTQERIGVSRPLSIDPADNIQQPE